jgi:dethiobiotin synthetase
VSTHSHGRPTRLIGVVGTGTEIGKTWVTSRLLASLRARGIRVAARKPVQSYEPNATTTDAAQLATASGEDIRDVCPPHRCYPLAMAPPMAADALGRGRLLLQEIVEEIRWPADIDVGFVETVGGVRSPLAHDGDSVDLLRRLQVDLALLVADAGLGTINSVRLSASNLAPLPVVVFLNRFDAGNELHRLNRQWLTERDGLQVFVDVEEVPPLTRLEQHHAALPAVCADADDRARAARRT